MSKSTQSTDPVKPFMLTTDRTDPLAHLPWRFRPFARFLARSKWTPLDVARVDKAHGKLYNSIDWSDDPSEAQRIYEELGSQIDEYRKLSDALAEKPARVGTFDRLVSPKVTVKVAAMAPAKQPKPAKAPRKPSRSADSIILDAIAAYRAETEAGEGRGHLGVYAAERIYDSLTGGQRSALTRKLNTIGFDDGSGNRPNSRFISFAGQCVYGIELPEETPSEGFPATPPMGFSELVAERQAIASEIVAAILEVIPSKDEDIDAIARQHARGIAYAARLRREDKDGWRAESSDRLFWFSLGQQARDDYNRFLDLMGIVHEWSEEDGDYEPHSWRYARFIGMCVTGSPICLPSHFPIPPDDFDLAEDQEDIKPADDDTPLDFAPSWAEYCQGAIVTWPDTPVPSFLGDEAPATIIIEGTPYSYAIEPEGIILTRPDDVRHAITIGADGPSCSCPSYAWRPGYCKHGMALIAGGLLPADTPSGGFPDPNGVSDDTRSLVSGASKPAERRPDDIGQRCRALVDRGPESRSEGLQDRHHGHAGCQPPSPPQYRAAQPDPAGGPDRVGPDDSRRLIARVLIPADTPSPDFPEPTPEDWEDIYRGRDAIDDDHDTPSGWELPCPDDFPEDHSTMTPEEARELLASHGLAPISGGAPEEGDEQLAFDEWEGADDKFALRVIGDSMIDEHIKDGDYVIIQKQSHARDGQIVAVRDSDGEATLKRIFKEKNRIRLEPANKTMSPVYRDKVEIIGLLVGVVRKY